MARVPVGQTPYHVNGKPVSLAELRRHRFEQHLAELKSTAEPSPKPTKPKPTKPKPEPTTDGSTTPPKENTP